MDVLDDLPLVSRDARERIRAAPRTEVAHRALLGTVPAMNAVQTGGFAPRSVLSAPLTAVAWNVERCLFPKQTAAHLSPLRADVVLLSEVDWGMARTGQRHTTAEVARGLEMAYAFGVEFFEMGLGGATERVFCIDEFNSRGWHGNAILSKVPFERVTMVRLDDHGHWFSEAFGADPGQPRIGGRMALLAVLAGAAGPVCVVSTHLESNADAAHRAQQFDRLLDAVDAFAPGLPVLIGGDLNTGNHMPPDFDWRSEALFERAQARGYDWSFSPEGMTTRPSLITPHPARSMKLDWFCARALACVETGLLSSLTEAGKPLSDHDAVWCRAAAI